MSKFGSIFDHRPKPDTELDAEKTPQKPSLLEDLDDLLSQNSSATPGLLRSSALFFLETLFYFLMVVALLGVIFFNRLALFDLFEEMMASAEVKKALGGSARIQDMGFIVRMLLGTIAILSFIIARNFHGLRHRGRELAHLYKSILKMRKKVDH